MRKMSSILLALLATVVVTEVMAVGVLLATGRLNGQKLDLMAQVLRGDLTGPSREARQLAVDAQPASHEGTTPVVGPRAETVEGDRLDADMMQRTVAQLRAQAGAALSDLEKREEEFRQEQEAWRKSIQGEVDERRQEGMDNMKRILDTMRPREAKRYLMEWPEDVTVQLLREMDDRKVGQILGECKTPAEQKKAAELMMKLREGA